VQVRARSFSPVENRERWLISYTDVLTILLALFVAIAAQTLRKTLVVLPPHEALPSRPAVPPPEPSPSRQALLQVEETLKQRGLDLRLEKRGLVISLPQTILFPSGDEHVTPSALPIISEIAEALRDLPNKVALVGHADSIPIHNHRFENNWELSAARSLNLLNLLTTRYNIPESRLLVQSEGSNDPKSSNETESGRAGNRRVEILILDDL